MKQHIESLLRQAVSTLSKTDNLSFPTDIIIQIERPRDPTHGDFSSNIAMILAKSVGMAPHVFATRLIQAMPLDTHIQNISLAGPGFINFTLTHHHLQLQFETMWASPTLGVIPENTPQHVVVDYSSPNLAKEMHVGHLRSTIIGDAIANILELKGYRVTRQNHVGDWGTQFGMLLAHLDDCRKTHAEDVQLNDLECFYKEAKQRFDTDPSFAERSRQCVVLLQSGDAYYLSLWRIFIQLSLAHCQAVYSRLGVLLQPSDVRAESAYNPVLSTIVDSLRQKGFLVDQDGTQCVFLEQFKGKDKEPLPIIVQKRDGGFLYASTDLAAIEYRNEVLHADRVLYVVDARQTLHFQQVFALAYEAGFASPNMQLEHVKFGMVLDKSGKPYKSRDGGVTKLADLLNEAHSRAKQLIESKQTTPYSPETGEHMARVLSVASVKYADLSKNRINDYVFDWDTMLSFEGNTAPYLLYAFTRVHSLFIKADVDADTLDTPLIIQEPSEITLLKHLIVFPEVIDTAADKATPHLLCTYLYELAGLFSSFYEACPILNQTDVVLRSSRLRLAALTARVLKHGLLLLGIETLNKM